MPYDCCMEEQLTMEEILRRIRATFAEEERATGQIRQAPRRNDLTKHVRQAGAQLRLPYNKTGCWTVPKPGQKEASPVCLGARAHSLSSAVMGCSATRIIIIGRTTNLL